MTNRLNPLALVMTFALASSAGAQTPPAGNAHPEVSAVGEEDGSLAEPFGPFTLDWTGKPTEARRAMMAQKVAFAQSVDIEPLRSVVVFHGGRVKILDTLARETVRAIAGRRTYLDYVHREVPGEPADIETHAYDPLFTLLDLIIDPGYYLDKPLVHVGYLPLRRVFVERAFPGDDEQQGRWMKLTRLSPTMVLGPWAQVAGEYGMRPGYGGAFDDVGGGLSLWERSGSNMLLVAPARSDATWAHISNLALDAPARRAALRLGDAWRAGDAAGASSAAAALAAALREIGDGDGGADGAYPIRRAALELMYNRANAFEWGLWIYLLSLVALLLALGTGRRWLIASGVVLLAAALGLHLFGFVLRCVIAERYAIQNQFESITGVSLFAVIVASAIMLARRQWLFGAAAAATGFLALVTATQTGVPGQDIAREAAILNTSVLLKYHVTTVLVSYGLITLGFVVSVFYLSAYYLSPKHAEAGPLADGRVALGAGLADVPRGDAPSNGLPEGASRQRTLRDLDTAQITILQLAFWTLGVGIMLGAWWADHSWGRWWAFDPKETWALVTWIVYLAVVHMRIGITGRRRALVTAWMSVLGFIVMLWTYFGVNLLLPGLHAYA